MCIWVFFYIILILVIKGNLYMGERTSNKLLNQPSFSASELAKKTALDADLNQIDFHLCREVRVADPRFSVTTKDFTGLQAAVNNLGLAKASSAVHIEGMTKAERCQITVTGHGVLGHRECWVYLSGIIQPEWRQLNGWHQALIIDANTLQIRWSTSNFATAYDPDTDPGQIRIVSTYEKYYLHLPAGIYNITSDFSVPGFITLVAEPGAHLVTSTTVACTGRVSTEERNGGANIDIPRGELYKVVRRRGAWESIILPVESGAYIVIDGNRRQINRIISDTELWVSTPFSNFYSDVSYQYSTRMLNGSNTAFQSELRVGDTIKVGTEVYVVMEIGSQTKLTLNRHPKTGVSSASFSRGVRVRLEGGIVAHPYHARLFHGLNGTKADSYGTFWLPPHQKIYVPWFARGMGEYTQGMEFTGFRNQGGIGEAIDQCPQSGSFIIPAGYYCIYDTIYIYRNGIQLLGETRAWSHMDTNSTHIYFYPTSLSDVAIHACHYSTGTAGGIQGGMLWDFELDGIRLTNGNTTTYPRQIFLRAVDLSHSKISNIFMQKWDGAKSIGIECQGRELTTYENCRLMGFVPLRITRTMHYHNGTLDTHSFRNMYLISNDLKPATDPESAVVKLDYNKGAVNNTVFDGFQDWVGGYHGFYWDDTGNNMSGQGLSFINVKHEQANSGGWSFYIKHATNLTNVLFLGCNDNQRSGGFIYLRNVRGANIISCRYWPPTPGKFLDIKDCHGVHFQGCAVINGATIELNKDMTELFRIMGKVGTFGHEFGLAGYYVDATLADDQKVAVLGTNIHTKKATVVDGGTLDVAGYSGGTALVQVITTPGTGTTEGGLVAVTSSHADGTGTVLSGTPNLTGVRGTASKLNVYRDATAGRIRVQNNLGESRDVMVVVYWQ